MNKQPRINLLDQKDKLQHEFWLLELKYRQVYAKKRELLSKLLSLGRKRTDVSNKIVEIINEIMERDGR